MPTAEEAIIAQLLYNRRALEDLVPAALRPVLPVPPVDGTAAELPGPSTQFELFCALSFVVVCAANFCDVRNFRNRLVKPILFDVAGRSADLLPLLDPANTPTARELREGMNDVEDMRMQLHRLYEAAQLKRERRQQLQSSLGIGMCTGIGTLFYIGYTVVNPAAGLTEAAKIVAKEAAKRSALYAGGAVLVSGACWYFTELQIEELNRLLALLDQPWQEAETLLDQLRAARNARRAADRLAAGPVVALLPP